MLATTYHYIMLTELCIRNYTLIIKSLPGSKTQYLICYIPECLKIHSRKELIHMNQCVKKCTETLIQYYSVSQTLSLTRELICVSWCETSITATSICCCLEPWVTWGKKCHSSNHIKLILINESKEFVYSVWILGPVQVALFTLNSRGQKSPHYAFHSLEP